MYFGLGFTLFIKKLKQIIFIQRYKYQYPKHFLSYIMNNTVQDNNTANNITTGSVSSNDIHVTLRTTYNSTNARVITNTEANMEKQEEDTEKQEEFVNKSEHLNECPCNELCKCIHSNKSCPTCTCRKSTCNNKVLINIQLNKAHYYCSQHMRCGLDVENKCPCKGCLNTYQKKH